MEITNFADIETEFIQRAHDAVWCASATVSTAGNPRSRVLHPIWEGNIGWIVTRRHSLKEKHLAKLPRMWLTYLKDPINPIYVDCLAEWIDDTAEKQRIWELFRNAPEPLGYDPALIFKAVDAPDSGLLKLTPSRIELYSLVGENKIWRA